jgi:5-methylcytosine-specific restriction protein A
MDAVQTMVPCRHPGCSALVPPGQKYCDKHKACTRRGGQPSASVATTADGSGSQSSSLQRIPLRQAWLKKGQGIRRQRSWITSFRIEEIRSSSGTGSNWQALVQEMPRSEDGNEDETPTYHY